MQISYYFASGSVANYCDQRVCTSLSAHIPQKPHVQISPNFLYMLPVAVLRSSSDGIHGNAIRYVLPVLWMTSCFLHNGANGPESKTTHYVSSS